MTEQEMWNAVKNSDTNYDGLFFYAVKTTKIFCRPSCKSKLPKKENICYFKSEKQAKNSGFRPCKRCRSELLEFQPTHEIANEIKQKLNNAVLTNSLFTLEDIGFSQRRLTQIFKQEYGITPKKYIDCLRLNMAKQMLINTNKKIIDIAYEIGFYNLSAFNRFFKNKTGKTPSEYRKIMSDYKSHNS